MSINYGTTKIDGEQYKLTGDADYTNRLLQDALNIQDADEGDEFEFEMSAPAVDENGDSCTIYWIFSAEKGNEIELDQYDYDTANRVEY